MTPKLRPADAKENTRGIALMVLAMAMFAIEDSLIKASAAALSSGQILFILGLGGVILFGALCWAQGIPLISRNFLIWPVLLRNAADVTAAMGFVTALGLIPLATASAILQATPLLVTMGAALFLGEQVGWRRWSAILIGLLGVVLILRPGLEGFSWASLLAVQATLCLALRDLVTRFVPDTVPTLQISTYAFALVVPAGAILVFGFGQSWKPVEPREMVWLGIAVIFGTIGYYAIVSATRIGDVGIVSPFRYTRLVFAMILAVAIFSERPDAFTLIGSAIVIGSGLYAYLRERALLRRNAAD